MTAPRRAHTPGCRQRSLLPTSRTHNMPPAANALAPLAQWIRDMETYAPN
jgi:hypothetical protein